MRYVSRYPKGPWLPGVVGIESAAACEVAAHPQPVDRGTVFDHHFTGEARSRPARKTEAGDPAILRWCIDGARSWQERRLDVPASIAAASAAYFDEEDTVGQFLQDETRTDPHCFAASEELISRFNLWAERQGLGTWTERTLVKELRQRGFQAARNRRAARPWPVLATSVMIARADWRRRSSGGDRAGARRLGGLATDRIPAGSFASCVACNVKRPRAGHPLSVMCLRPQFLCFVVALQGA